MLQRLGLLWRGLRWRLGTSALLLLVAAVAVFAATVGPLYLGTADGTVLHGTLNGQGEAQNAVAATATVESQQSEPLARESLAQERRSAMRHWFGAGVLTVDVGIRTGVDDAIADLVYRPGVCSHLTFVQGNCVRSGLQVDITQEDAGFLHLKLGSELVPEVPVSRAVGRNRNAPGKTFVPLEPSGQSLLVVGIVREVNTSNPYWLGDDFDGSPPSEPTSARHHLDYGGRRGGTRVDLHRPVPPPGFPHPSGEADSAQGRGQPLRRPGDHPGRAGAFDWSL